MYIQLSVFTFKCINLLIYNQFVHTDIPLNMAGNHKCKNVNTFF